MGSKRVDDRSAVEGVENISFAMSRLMLSVLPRLFQLTPPAIASFIIPHPFILLQVLHHL